MLTDQAITLLSKAEAISAANTALQQALETNTAAVLPDGFTLHQVECLKEQRRRARGVFTTTSLNDFANYVSEHKEPGATVFVSDDIKATAILNLGAPNAPGQADNAAKLSMIQTAAYQALLKVDGTPLPQKVAVEFLEDWIDSITFVSGTGPLEKGASLEALRKVTIDAARKVESTTGNLSASLSSFEQVTASSATTMPEFVYFKCEPYHGLDVREFVMRLGILTGSEKPQIQLRIQKHQSHVEEMAAELVTKAQEAIKACADGLPVIRGAYERKN